jgi:hypothetical protein
VELAIARPPFVAPEYAVASALPVALAFELADPPLLATDTAVAEAAQAAVAPIIRKAVIVLRAWVLI